MRPLPLSLWLLAAAQVDAQAQLPTAIRKMSPDPGEKFYHEYCAFTDDGSAEVVAGQPYAERRAVGNASVPLPYYHAPFAPHAESALGTLPGRTLRSAGGPRAEGWRLLRRAAAAGGGALARLEGRGWSCPSGTSNCSSVGYPDACCGSGTSCVKIDDTGLGSVGCCPSGSACSGSVMSCASGDTACSSQLGGGCCISGYVCEGIGCVPSSALFTTITSTSTSVVSGPTPSTVIVTTTVTESQSFPSSRASSTSTSTTATQTAHSSTSTNNDISAPVRPTGSDASSSTGSYCPTGFYACLASAGGGCCQTGRDCQTTSCGPPTSSTTIVTANGVTVAVPATAVPSPTSTADCAAGWFLCASGPGSGGCCPSGYSCGTASCALGTAGATASVAKEPPGSGAARLEALLGRAVALLALLLLV